MPDIQLEMSNIPEITKALDLLSQSAIRAADALHDLDGAPHGGISITVAGDVASIEIKPKD